MFFKLLSLLFVAIAFTEASPVLISRVDAPPFNPSLFKNLSVTRGLDYHYYASPAVTGKPTLVFLHGFPSSSFDWRHQVSFFQNQGYGIIVPDMLGYGGTAKPLDPDVYASSLISKDMIDILDAEGIDKAVVIGHDWGSKITGRLANYFPERFYAFGFLAVGYVSQEFFALPFNDSMSRAKAFLGYENFGYFDFLASKDADQIIAEHDESFFDIWHVKDTVRTITEFSPFEALEAFLKNDTRVATGDFITPEERAIQIEFYRQGGWTAPLTWYKIVTGSVERDDNKGIPEANTVAQQPVFYGTAERDYFAIAPAFLEATIQFSNGTLTTREYDTGHWVMLEARDEVNSDLLQWIEGLGLDSN